MNILPRLIGISAKQHCGKSTLAKLLAEKYPGYKVMSVGDELKKDCSERFDVPLELFYSQDGKKRLVAIKRKTVKINGVKINVKANVMTVRELMTWWGTDVIRKEVDDLYWLKKLAAGMDLNSHVIVDDIRFKNEAEYIRRAGGLLIRLEPYEGRGKMRGDAHISETDLDDYKQFDLVVAPEFGTLPKLANAIDLLLVNASKVSWQKIHFTKDYEVYTHCTHGARPFKHIKVCEACARKCKMFRKYVGDRDKYERAQRRYMSVDDTLQLAKAC